MPKPTAQACHAMTTYYIGRYEAARGHAPVLNRNKARYTFEGLLMDYSTSEVKAILDYFFEHFERDLEWFNYNYEKVIAAKKEHERNETLRDARRIETAQRLEQWKQRQSEWKKS